MLCICCKIMMSYNTRLMCMEASTMVCGQRCGSERECMTKKDVPNGNVGLMGCRP